MFVTREEMNDMLQLVADVTGRHITEQIKNFYFNQCKAIECSKVRTAVAVFSSKGHFPTVNELLSECGYCPVRTAEERHQSEQRRAKVKELHESGGGYVRPETAWGEYAFELRMVTEDAEEAKTKFAQWKNDHLFKNGWHVRSEEFHECVAEVTEGKRFKPAKMFKVFFFSVKPEPTATHQKPMSVKQYTDFKARSAGEVSDSFS